MAIRVTSPGANRDDPAGSIGLE